MSTVTGRIIDVDYVFEPELTLRVFAVDTDGQHFIAEDTEFSPYFYAIPEDGNVGAAATEIAETTFTDDGEELPITAVETVNRIDGRKGREVLKVVAELPPQVPKLKDMVWDLETVAACREYDIPFYKRYLIDHALDPTGWADFRGTWKKTKKNEPAVLVLEEPPKKTGEEQNTFQMLAFDLEVYGDEIIMCSFFSEDFEQVLVSYDDGWDEPYVEVVADERELIERIIAVVNEHDPDILTGYNTDEFDFQVLRERAEEHDLTLTMGRTGERMMFQRRGRFAGANLEGRMHLDLYAFVANVLGRSMETETLSLDAVSEEMLGERKDDVSWEQIKAYWEQKEHLSELAAYALQDSRLAYRLAEQIVPQILSLSVLTGLPPFDTCRHTYGQLVEHFMLKQAAAQGIVAPNRPGQEERSRRYSEGAYAGGFVYEPEKGLHKNIALFDFRSLYPTIIVAHNISPDTLDLEDCTEAMTVEVDDTGNTYAFCQDEPGFIPAILEDVVRERYELKQRMGEMSAQERTDADHRQGALKILANSFYGYLGYNGARWYSRACAEATTYLGRRYIHEAIDTAEEMGFEVVYGDTDSVFLSGEDVRERKGEFLEQVNETLPEFMELEFEGFYPRGLFTYTKSGQGAKKKYALLAEDGSVKITGFEQVRRDWSPIAKETQEAVIRHVLEDEVDKALAVVKDRVASLRKGRVPLEKLKIYTQMKKKPENYKSKMPHTEAAKRAIERGEDISPGDVIEYVVTNGAGPISDRTELIQFAKDYDPTYYIDNQVVPVALRVLKVFGYTEDQLKGEGKQTGLGRFGS